jgi:hypothetical protein
LYFKSLLNEKSGQLSQLAAHFLNLTTGLQRRRYWSNTVNIDLAEDLSKIDLEAALTWQANEAALEPLAATLFEIAALGEPIDIDAIMETLIANHDLNEARSDRARGVLERNIEAGDSKLSVLSGIMTKSPRAVVAAAGALQWELWRAEHEHDIVPRANGVAVRIVAKHIARRCRDVLGESLSPEEAAWAAIEGAGLAKLPIDRSAWTDALEGGFSGDRERRSEISRMVSN